MRFTKENEFIFDIAIDYLIKLIQIINNIKQSFSSHVQAILRFNHILKKIKISGNDLTEKLNHMLCIPDAYLAHSSLLIPISR